jgi:hypothetical protein
VSDVRNVGDGLLRKNPGRKGNRTVSEEVGDGILVLHAKSAGLHILEGNTTRVPGAAVRGERRVDEVEEVGSEGAGCRRGKWSWVDHEPICHRHSVARFLQFEGHSEKRLDAVFQLRDVMPPSQRCTEQRAV